MKTSVLHDGLSTKPVSDLHIVPQTTLRRCYKKCSEVDINWNELEAVFPKIKPNCECRKIFSNEEQAELYEFLIKCEKVHHDRPPKAARKLAFDLLVANNETFPDSWQRERLISRK